MQKKFIVKGAPRSVIHGVSVILLGASLVSCAQITPQIAPWERDLLARPQMMTDPYPAFSAIRSHMYESREAAARIKPSGSGSACGCY
jgi:hypothetical protein